MAGEDVEADEAQAHAHHQVHGRGDDAVPQVRRRQAGQVPPAAAGHGHEHQADEHEDQPAHAEHTEAGDERQLGDQ